MGICFFSKKSICVRCQDQKFTLLLITSSGGGGGGGRGANAPPMIFDFRIGDPITFGSPIDFVRIF